LCARSWPVDDRLKLQDRPAALTQEAHAEIEALLLQRTAAGSTGRSCTWKPDAPGSMRERTGRRHVARLIRTMPHR